MNNRTLLLALFILIAGVGLGYWLSSIQKPVVGSNDQPTPIYYRNPMDPAITSMTPAKDAMGMDYLPVYEEKKAEPEVLFYRNPMNPEITSPLPAKDSMGMDYIPVYASEQTDVSGMVTIDPAIVQNMGVRTAPVVSKDFYKTIRAVGRVDVNEERINQLHPKVEGWVEEIFIEKTGEPVNGDDILLGIYSPKLVASQQEYLLALSGRNSLSNSSIAEVRDGADQLISSARERLRFFDVPEHQIEELEESRQIKRTLHVHSPATGTITRVGVRQGQFVTPKSELYQITDLSEVWVYVDVYDYELPWVKVGDPVEMTLASAPGEIFKGVLSYIYPYAQSTTRTTRLRVVFANPNGQLRPEMFTEVRILADRKDNVLVIPSEAVVRSGKDTQVFIARGQGKFEPRVVTLGVDSNDEVVVTAGLTEGDRVVTSAQFLIDSESKLNEATAKMMSNIRSKAKPSDPERKSREATEGHHHHD